MKNLNIWKGQVKRPYFRSIDQELSQTLVLHKKCVGDEGDRHDMDMAVADWEFEGQD